MATHKRNHAFAVCFYLAVIVVATEAVIMGVLHFLPQLGYWGMVVDPAMLAIVTSPTIYLLVLRSLQRATVATEAAKESARAKEEWERTFDAVPDLIALIDTDHCILRANRAMSDRLGCTPEQAVGCHCYEVIHGLSAPPDFCPHAKLLVSGKEERAEVVENRLNGIFDVSATPLRNEAGQLVGCVHVAHDITDRKRAEEDMRRYAAELEAANKALEEANRLAESATRAKSEFLANMSHEIRTPMTAILGFADLLCEDILCCTMCPKHAECQRRRDGKEIGDTIRRNGKHLLALINDILDLSKIEAGKLQIERTICSLAQLVAEVASLMRVPAEEKHLKLETELTGPLPEMILTDPLRMRQILVNLVGNAIKFTERGEVRITARLISDIAPPRLQFDVADTGIGMNKSQVAQLFKPFSQVDCSTTRRFGGTGLGLAISKRLAETLGGSIDVHSEPGKGSTFTITIDPGPLDGIRMIRNTHETLLDLPPAMAAATPDKIVLHGRILLAEDGPDNQRLISLLLTNAGAEVTMVENGQLAVEQARGAWEQGRPFDVILMDMQMPVMDGYEATRRLRALGYTGPIIALTAHAMNQDRQKCLDAGCNDYLAKPIDRQRLLAAVAAWSRTDESTSVVPSS